jgi:large subunit ribosomal protein L28
MSKRCDLTGVGPQSGNRVSHSNRKTRRRFEPNLHVVSLHSESLGQSVSLRITAATLRSVDHNGGLDSFLTSTSSTKLTEDAQKLKKKVKLAKAASAEKAA